MRVVWSKLEAGRDPLDFDLNCRPGVVPVTIWGALEKERKVEEEEPGMEWLSVTFCVASSCWV